MISGFGKDSISILNWVLGLEVLIPVLVLGFGFQVLVPAPVILAAGAECGVSLKFVEVIFPLWASP